MELVHAGDDAETIDHEDVSAHVGDAGGDIHIQAGDDAHNRDKSGDRQDDAKQGEEAAELVGAQSVESELEGLGESNPGSLEAFEFGAWHGRGAREWRDGGQPFERCDAQKGAPKGEYTESKPR